MSSTAIKLKKDNAKILLLNLTIIIFFSLFFFKQISFITQDLGRHITNGKIFILNSKIISTNFYSYTQPDFVTINHHWLSGVIFYLIQNWIGFNGLSFFYSFLSGFTIFLFFKITQKNSNLIIALLVSLALIPLTTYRFEIRPEGFSYLFLAINYLIYTEYLKNNISFFKVLIVVFLLQILWVNLHIFFIFSIFISIVFTFVEFIKLILKQQDTKFLKMVIIFLTTIFASLFNPFGIKGLLEPLNIFNEYGYSIVENQSIFFMQSYRPMFFYIIVQFFAVMFFVVAIYFIYKKQLVQNLVLILICFVFLLLAFFMIRMIPVFGFFLLPYLGKFIYQFTIEHDIYLSNWILYLMLITLVPGHNYSIFDKSFGIGLQKNINSSADFYIKNSIQGPLFNNYDIGGYLIYHLYDKQKVFVDNRPEAYSYKFFKEQYIPMQEDEKIWLEQDKVYNFNSIYFYRHDLTPWAQTFLKSRVNDNKWVPVFVDEVSIIFVKNNDKNNEVISKYRIPNENFIFE